MNFDNNKKAFGMCGIKYTKQRNIVLDILINAQQPLTADQIYSKIKESSCTINLSTVYRILEVFVLKDLVLKSNIDINNKAVYEINNMEHNHKLVCMKCKKIFVIDECPMESFEKHIEKKTNFNILSHKLELYGHCNDCK